MAINDYWLSDIASFMGADSYYLGFSSDTDFTIDDFTTTSFDGEIGSRVTCTAEAVDNELTISGTRSATLVVDTVNGDRLGGFGLFQSAVATQPIVTVKLPNTLHTISFDLDVDNVVTVNRSV